MAPFSGTCHGLEMYQCSFGLLHHFVVRPCVFPPCYFVVAAAAMASCTVTAFFKW